MNNQNSDLAWFQSWKSSPDYAKFAARPIAYFCAEFALENRIPTFSGGLGVLAGDVVREAADRELHMVAVGLYYRLGYVCPTTNANGDMVEVCTEIPPQRVGLEPVLDGSGKPLLIRVPIQNRSIDVRAWKWTRGNLNAYLLDTDVETNTAADRAITHRLYVSDRETRFKQEIVLGIGGLRFLEALAIHPSIYHLNEGHSALLGLELIRHQMKERQLGFDEAKQFARRRVVLTNHTLVAAGNEIFTDDLASLLLKEYSEEIAVPMAEIMRMGLVADSSSFSMTMLALRCASVVNAVSKLHAKKVKEIWHDHPMAAVTNGIHLPTWDRVDADVTEPGTFWRIHQQRKTELLALVKEKTGRAWDPDTLLLGWARRIASYKRPLCILEDAKRFAEIARNTKRPVRILFSGRPHPADETGTELLRQLQSLADGSLKDVAAYLPDYNLGLSAAMVSGCDVWLNTPVVGFEACGTSGMKASLNGVLPCSTKDGWVDEADLSTSGWLLDDAHVSRDILDRIEKTIAPLYYERNTQGIPEAWEEGMRQTRAMIMGQFSATRMLRGYVQTLYT
ncbi:alpha-glucan family phosphorylase [Candidatus Uhrbacteria bacterium]|nr:alpha-glucan family phosphorylase [Candidatus Uhrbacteria bacterium]